MSIYGLESVRLTKERRRLGRVLFMRYMTNLHVTRAGCQFSSAMPSGGLLHVTSSYQVGRFIKEAFSWR